MVTTTIPKLDAMLTAKGSPVQIAKWLRSDYLPALIQRFNTNDVRKRLGLYAGERIPENERNLTDVRNRISLIIEYELARLSNQMLDEHGLVDLFWGYVVANRFPDLEVRHRNGNRFLRIEVKCLQSIAEEKSANFDTLIKDINPGTDFVVVFLWEWAQDGHTFRWDRSPALLEAFVFQAYSLAALRDQYWLNKPPANLGGGYQGFDLRYAVNCNNGAYNEEEGNYGKLLRIWQEDFPFRPPATPELKDTETEYLRFRSEVVAAGARSLGHMHLPKLSAAKAVTSIVDASGVAVGAYAGQFGFFARIHCKNADIVALMQKYKLKFAVAMTEKYSCTGYELVKGTLEPRFSQLAEASFSAAI
ncbi:MAG: hypothetical protein IPI87_16815 [Betaproteobacteria bacterium]|nr:hypothetical protein [Betaproteobacteria bacterium]